jgi:DNA recombination protein RmuC
MEILLLIAGLIIGAASVYFILKFRYEGIKGKADERASMLESAGARVSEELKAEREKVLKLSSDYSSLKADHANVQRKLDEQKLEIQELQEKFTKEFENLANRIFEEKSQRFTDQNRSSLDEILKPLSERIKDFEKKVNDIHLNDTKERASLTQQLKSLHELNQQMTREASNLTRALKGDTKSQGSWGEFILESILEKSGLVRDREYIVQTMMTDEDGRRYRPDVIIMLPDNKSIIIDSKVSLTAYEVFCSADDDEEKARALASHISSIRTHIKQLSQKSYQSIYHLKSLDFVMLFMPVEPAFALAMQNDTNLWNDAFERNIVIVSPTTLLATLRTICNIWKQEKMNRNALEIAEKGGALYDKFEAMMKDLIEVGNRLRQTQNSYDDAMKKLHTGRGNIILQVEKIKQLGAKTTKTLPKTLIERAREYENPMFPDEE